MAMAGSTGQRLSILIQDSVVQDLAPTLRVLEISKALQIPAVPSCSVLDHLTQQTLMRVPSQPEMASASMASLQPELRNWMEAKYSLPMKIFTKQMH